MKTFANVMTGLALAMGLCACASKGPLAVPGQIVPFTTDGCSLFPDRSPCGRSDWCQCCVAHDLAYWRGGTAEERRASDEVFSACVQKAANGGLAALMYTGVRLAALPHFNTTFRWGYGWPYYRPYGALTPEETTAADRQELAYREQHPVLQCPGQAILLPPQ